MPEPLDYARPPKRSPWPSVFICIAVVIAVFLLAKILGYA